MPDTPAFGSADLTNCEREQIHLAASIQPHGFLAVLREPDLVIVQASANLADLAGRPLEDVLGTALSRLSPDLATQVAAAAVEAGPAQPTPVRFALDGRTPGRFEGAVHREPEGALILEFEPAPTGERAAQPARQLGRAIERLGAAQTEPELCDTAVLVFRSLTGFDRVMVYRFDADGHGEVVAEDRRPDLEPFLGLHYPATDIPQRARELYLRNRVRVLVDVYYTPAPLVPRRSPLSGQELDMSLCYLRSMSPLHLQYLQNMGVTATLVCSLVRDGRLWGLVACHHYAPRRVPFEIRAACEILSEIVSTRLSTLERQAQTRVDAAVRQVERQVVEAVSATGDWRPALFVSPRNLISLVGAGGAALVYDREIMTAGDTPSSLDLYELTAWIHRHHPGHLFETNALAGLEPRFAHLTSVAAGVMAISLSEHRSDYLLWFRREQPQTVTWAGDPHKPMMGDDPLHLSPRRSFAVWTEMVRGTARPWSAVERGTGAAFRTTLSGIVQQIQAVRVLIAHHQLERVSRVVEQGWEPMALALETGAVLASNAALVSLFGRTEPPAALDDLIAHFTTPTEAGRILGGLVEDRTPWSGELALRGPDGTTIPIHLRADVVPAEAGGIMGFVLLFRDLTTVKRTEAALRQLDETIRAASQPEAALDRQARRELGEVMEAVIASAREAVAVGGTPSLPSLEDIESLTRRAAELTRQMLGITTPPPPRP